MMFSLPDSVVKMVQVFISIRRLPTMWTVIYIAPTARMAERIRTKLTEEGFLVQVRPINLTRQQYEILVPEGELDEVQEVLSTILHL
jgi:hypothetical protein